MNDLGIILVTGASGKTGRAVVAALARAGASARALVHRHSQAAVLFAVGAREIIIADLLLPSDLRRAMKGARAVYHICPNVHPRELEIGRFVIAAAREAGVERVVLHSVLHPQTEKMSHHWNKLRVEEELIESGLNYTILQPAPYMQNLPANLRLAAGEWILRNPYPVTTRLSLLDLDDLGEAAAAVFTRPGHEWATYEIVGTLPLSQEEVAAMLSEVLGRPVRAEAEPVEEWDSRMRAAGMGDYPRAALKRMFDYYRRYGLAGNPNVLRCLLGREPSTVPDFARRYHLFNSGKLENGRNR